MAQNIRRMRKATGEPVRRGAPGRGGTTAKRTKALSFFVALACASKKSLPQRVMPEANRYDLSARKGREDNPDKNRYVYFSYPDSTSLWDNGLCRSEDGQIGRDMMKFRTPSVFSLPEILTISSAFLTPPLFLSLAFSSVAGRTWRITNDGSGDAPSVQAGIDSAAVGDVIFVGPGTYYENLDFLGKDIVLKSELGPEVTILDGSSRDSSVVVFKHGETRAAVLEGFTITGGTGSRATGGSTRQGGGIWCELGSPTILANRIIGNRTEYIYASGAGMLVGTGFAGPLAPLIEGNLFEGNTAGQNGGGLGLKAPSEAIVRRNVFRGNTCRADGGGLWVYLFYGSVIVKDNQFFDNVAGDHGGGLHAANSGHAGAFDITGNTFVRNRTLGPGFFGDTGSGGAIAALLMTGTISNNTIVANDGTHLTHCGGGGLLLYLTTPDLLVTNNIFVLNTECGVACWEGGRATMGPNIVWYNEPSNLGVDLGWCPSYIGQDFIVADPLFCGAAVDDYRVSSDSPALASGQVFGAYSQPGCGPGTPVRPITWGRIKALYK